MGKFSELSECELLTMKCIWDAGDPISAQEIMEQLKTVYNLDYKDTTVYTFLKYLRKKGFIESFKEGITYYYPVRDEEDYKNQYLTWMLKFWFKGSIEALVVALTKDRSITAEEMEKMKKMKKIIEGISTGEK